jgi:UDP-glucose 4-epimerase
MAYARTYGFKALILRLANIFGPTATHGVFADFKKKLSKNKRTLRILGDGTQSKSFLSIDAALDVFELVLKKNEEEVGIYNVGSAHPTTVREIADLVCQSMGCRPDYLFSKTGRGGWVGDVEDMDLSIKKLQSLKSV